MTHFKPMSSRGVKGPPYRVSGNELSVYGELLVLQRTTNEKCGMSESIVSRRHFNQSSLISLLAAAAMPDGTAAAQQPAATRRDVIRQELNSTARATGSYSSQRQKRESVRPIPVQRCFSCE